MRGQRRTARDIVDAETVPQVWNARFETDQLALAEAFRALNEETLVLWGSTADRPLNCDPKEPRNDTKPNGTYFGVPTPATHASG